ncbi:hypothetical protein [Amycolatopsis acidicola]|uniref:hypothetical protein n=1 Tax=Amycolatopsis acidicola TaxID=2596893 RepID=UPI001407D1FE|nr:hypothetical protein [Amycolatopsis acidicola]
MARHRLDENENDEKWGGPVLAEAPAPSGSRRARERETEPLRLPDKEKKEQSR